MAAIAVDLRAGRVEAISIDGQAIFAEEMQRLSTLADQPR